MSRYQQMTAQEFAARRMELPEAGRWHELHAGEPVSLQPPEDSHGNIVMNLSRELARWLQASRPVMAYAVHQVGLHVSSSPDTVYVPAISLFDTGPLFSQTDQVIASLVPRMVVDVASSNDRRCEMRQRTLAYLKLGVEVIWVPDPFKQEIQVLHGSRETRALGPRQQLEGGAVLPGFRMDVSQVFAQPSWWSGPASGAASPPAHPPAGPAFFSGRPDPEAN